MGNVKTQRWWWVRHAPVTVNKGRIYGNNDLPCDVDDKVAFSALAGYLPTKALLVTSALKRTHQTATTIEATGLNFRETIRHENLNEQSFGNWQGLSFEELSKINDGFIQHDYWLCPGHMRPPEGESFLDVIARVAPVIEDISNHHEAGDIISVSHGGVIRAALTIALGIDPERALGFVIDNLSVTRIDRIEKDNRLMWRVVTVNTHPQKQG